MRICAAAAALALAACTGDTGDTPSETGDLTGGTGCTSAPMELEVGTGAVAFEALAANDPVVIVHGPQGGWHVEIAGMLKNVSQEVSVAPKLVVQSSGRQIAGEQQPNLLGLAAYDDATCTGQFFGVRAFVDEIDNPQQDFVCGLGGEILELSVTVEDFANGDTVTESILVTAQNDEIDVEQYCQ